jgi:two-component system LytT family sensor kinase
MGTRAAREAPAFWQVLLSWTGVALFFHLQEIVLQVTENPSGQPVHSRLAYHLTSCWLWALFTPAIWLVTRHFPFKSKLRDTLVHLLAVFALMSSEALVLNQILPRFGLYRLTFGARLLRLAPLDLICYATLAALELARRSRLQAKRLEGDLFEARLEAIESQLRPHFLFNALNTVASLVRADQPQPAIRALAALGDVLRGSLRKTGTEVALGDELGLAERYLDLERARFGEGIRYRVNTAPGTAQARVPPLLLQPLVENALAHGRGSDGNVEVEIDVARCAGGLRIEVRDGGSGPLPGSSDGIGLSNTRARLQHLYGADGRFQLLSRQGGGAVAVVELPLREARP